MIKSAKHSEKKKDKINIFVPILILAGCLVMEEIKVTLFPGFRLIQDYN